MISFCQKFGMGLSGPITGYLMTWVGYRAGTALQPEAISGIEWIMTLVPAFFYIVVGLVMRKYIINNSYYNAMMAENSLPAAAIKEHQWAG